MIDITFIMPAETTLEYFRGRVPPDWIAHFVGDLSEVSFTHSVALQQILILRDSGFYPAESDPDPGEIALNKLPGFPSHLETVRYFDGHYSFKCGSECRALIVSLADGPELWVNTGFDWVAPGTRFASRARSDPSWNWNSEEPP